ncbi:MAG: MBL fold metallo-hydrolase [bacterium]
MRAATEIEITVLGSGTRVLLHDRSMSGYAVRRQDFFLLLDCGDGVIRRGLAAGLQMLEIDAILISHQHPDHVADLPPLLWALHGEGHLRSQRPLYLFGALGFKKFFEGISSLYGDWVGEIPLPIIVHEVFQQDFEIGPWRVHSLPMQHGIAANGYRLECDGKIIAYTGDTGPCAEAITLAREADLFICECSFPEGEEMPTHLTAKQAGQIAAEARCHKLLLTHFYPSCLAVDPASQARELFSGKVELAGDLMRLIIS